MKCKIFLSDFDGTLVNEDILDVVCGINNKYEESKEINEGIISGKISGLNYLKQRIDFLEGVSNEQIKELLDKENYLTPGAKELFAYLKQKGIITVLHSGNITPVLLYYKNLLGIDYIIGNEPRYENGKIKGIEMEDFKSRSFKVDGCKEILEKLSIKQDEIIAIGDSAVDAAIFEIAGLKIAINPKGGIEQKADYVVKDLNEVVEIIEKM